MLVLGAPNRGEDSRQRQNTQSAQLVDSPRSVHSSSQSKSVYRSLIKSNIRRVARALRTVPVRDA